MKKYHNHYYDIINSDKSLTQAQKAVYKLFCGLSKSSRRDNVEIAKSLIADKLALSKRTVDAAIKKLIALTYIKRMKAGGGDGKSYNVYRIFWMPNEFYMEQLKFLKHKEQMSEYKKVAIAIKTLTNAGVDSARLQNLLLEANNNKALARFDKNSLAYLQEVRKLKNRGAEIAPI